MTKAEVYTGIDLHLHKLTKKKERETSLQFFKALIVRAPAEIFPSHKALICVRTVMTLCHPVCFYLTLVSEVVRYIQAGSSASFHSHPNEQPRRDSGQVYGPSCRADQMKQTIKL